MAFLAQEELSPETNALKVSIIQEADPIKDKVSFCYYRLAKGISGILSYAKEGIRLWYRTKRPAYRQLCLKLTVWIDKRICLPKPGSGGAYKSASILGTAIPELSKKRQIGTWRGHIYLFNAVCGNSSTLYINTHTNIISFCVSIVLSTGNSFYLSNKHIS